MDQAHPAELRPPSGVGRVHPSLLQRCPEGLKPAPPTPASFGPRHCGNGEGRGRREQAHHFMSRSSRVTRLACFMLLAHLLAGALVIALENHLPGRPFFRSDEEGTADDPALPARSHDARGCGGWASQFQGRATHLIRAFQTQWRRSGGSHPAIVRFGMTGRGLSSGQPVEGAEGFRRH